VFFITGGIGVVVAVLMFITVRGRARGQAEPEMVGIEADEEHRINWKLVGGLFRNPSLLLIMAQGLFGTFPWSVLTFWFFRYLETERGYSSTQAMMAMIVAIIALALGYWVGGYFGDMLFKRVKQGRAIVAGIGVIVGAVFLLATMLVPVDRVGLFAGLLGLTGLAMSVASPNVISMTADVTLPEVRSTAQAVRKLFEDGGSAIAPLLAGLIATRMSLHAGILLICIVTWVICAILFAVLARRLPKDIESISQMLKERAEQAA
jgi:MFS family permease